jgi:triosephosphate isomerase
MLFINFKIYPQTFGQGALDLAKACEKAAEHTKVKIIPVVSPLDLRQIKQETTLEVWLQHVDLFEQGRHTGYISPLQAQQAGADGTLLNHSEHEIAPGKINQTLSKIKDLKSMVCFKTKGQAQNWLKKLNPQPDFIAYEPPELIAGETSVSQAKPEVIKRITELMPESNLIVGAGIKTKQDVEKSLELGAKGVLVASAVVKADNPEKKLLELAQGFNV